MKEHVGMGARAREAVELLWRRLPAAPRAVELPPEERYRAGMRWVLRLVVIRFAEARNLLPADCPAYAASYSLDGLWRELTGQAEANPLALETRTSAWPRILALFRLVYHGSAHPDLPIRAYGGELLEPAAPGPGPADPFARALALIEEPGSGPCDAVVLAILDRLCRAGDGRRIDFARIDCEYIGELYQAFLDSQPEAEPGGGIALQPSRRSRKASGAFYTPMRLAAATAARTLGPLCEEPSGPRPPEKILRLRVVDPAMGSGAFLVAALRHLCDRLVRSLYHHGRILPARVGTRVELTRGRPLELPCPPWDGAFDSMLRAHVRRFVVEHCLYGVDLDPLSVELARISLWLETMDRRLPFTFLDHKLKVGNSLVGARCAELAVYPLQAWNALGEDALVAQRAAEQLAHLEADAREPALPFIRSRPQQIEAQRHLARLLDEIHRVPVQLPDRKRARYRKDYLGSTHRRRLQQALDRWCALWFWWDSEETAPPPLPEEWYGDEEAGTGVARSIATRQRFFHWELEFPEVFAGRTPGFDAILANPPWEVLKPLDRASPAEVRQRRSEANWFIARSRPGGRFDARLRELGEDGESNPFRYQGVGDLNTYKLFLEQALFLCRRKGRLGLVLPAGLYSDRGSGMLRRLLVEETRWEWLFAMENRERIFPIDTRFRFAVVVAEKGGCTREINASFGNANPEEWGDGEGAVILRPRLPAGPDKPLAPFAESAGNAHHQVVRRLEEAGVSCTGRGRRAWRARYAREVDAGKRGESFFPAEHWLRRGFLPDELGVLRPPGDCRDGTPSLPLYQGAMVHQFDFCAAGWEGGEGRRARWQAMPWAAKRLHPQFFMDARTFAELPRATVDYKLAVRRITNATNERTVIAALVPPLPCTDKAAVLAAETSEELLALLAALNSFCVDAVARTRCAGANLDLHHLQALPLPPADTPFREAIATLALRLAGPHPWFAPLWLEWRQRSPRFRERPWGHCFAWGREERTRVRALLDGLVAAAFGLEPAHFDELLADCHHPADRLGDRTFRARLNGRGFWRVDSDLPPPRRQTEAARRGYRRLLAEGPEATVDAVLAERDPVAPDWGWAECERWAAAVERTVGPLRRQGARQQVLL
jgi:hypothetical protein